MFDWQVFDAAKLEVFRILALGISGFDNPLTLKSSQESAASLESCEPSAINTFHTDGTLQFAPDAVFFQFAREFAEIGIWRHLE